MLKSDQNKSAYSRTEIKYEKWEQEGRGTGSGPDYIVPVRKPVKMSY